MILIYLPNVAAGLMEVARALKSSTLLEREEKRGTREKKA
jgi:hypothetical protein